MRLNPFVPSQDSDKEPPGTRAPWELASGFCFSSVLFSYPSSTYSLKGANFKMPPVSLQHKLLSLYLEETNLI